MDVVTSVGGELKSNMSHVQSYLMCRSQIKIILYLNLPVQPKQCVYLQRGHTYMVRDA